MIWFCNLVYSTIFYFIWMFRFYFVVNFSKKIIRKNTVFSLLFLLATLLVLFQRNQSFLSSINCLFVAIHHAIWSHLFFSYFSNCLVLRFAMPILVFVLLSMWCICIDYFYFIFIFFYFSKSQKNHIYCIINIKILFSRTDLDYMFSDAIFKFCEWRGTGEWKRR